MFDPVLVNYLRGRAVCLQKAAFHHHEEILEEFFRGKCQAEVPGASHTWRIHSTASWLHNLQPHLDEVEEGVEESL